MKDDENNIPSSTPDDQNITVTSAITPDQMEKDIKETTTTTTTTKSSNNNESDHHDEEELVDRKEDPTTDNDQEQETTSDDIPPYTEDDLAQLIKAIKFAYPDYGIRRVHREIVEVASVKGKEPALKDVKLNEVKTIWKKYDLSSSSSSSPDHFSTAEQPNNHDGTNSVLKLYTVSAGDGSKKDDAAASAASTIEETTKEEGTWVHFFLDVPADSSGHKPHQVLINFSDKNNNNQDGTTNHRSRKRGNQKNKNIGEDIVKVQVAASVPGMGGDSIKHPMLLYNSDRSAMTFIHPSEQQEQEETVEDGYEQIRNLITSGGVGGALGNTGGTKGYFRCRVQKSKGIVSVDVSGLAPVQLW